jgi:hypothetical protein
VLGDVGQPQLAGGLGRELALDQVLTGPGVLQVLVTLLRPWQAPQAQLTHDPLDQLGVDYEALLDLECGFDPQDAVGATRAGVDIGDGIGEEKTADLAVAGLPELDVVIGGAIEADHTAGQAL